MRRARSVRRYFQLAVLITAREIDQQYEWSAHEPAGRRQGLEQSVIDVVKYDRSVAGLSDKDATMITFGRALFREHRVSSELWEKMVGHFGRQRTVQIMMIMGDYFRVGLHAERRRSAPSANARGAAACEEIEPAELGERLTLGSEPDPSHSHYKILRSVLCPVTNGT